jgi:hypothetical protein
MSCLLVSFAHVKCRQHKQVLQEQCAPAVCDCLVSPADDSKRAAVGALLDTLPLLMADPAHPPATARAAPARTRPRVHPLLARAARLLGRHPRSSEAYAPAPCASQAALIAAVDLIHSNGGKVHLFTTDLPNTGVHKLLARHHDAAAPPPPPATPGRDCPIDPQLAAKQDVLTVPDLRWRSAASLAAEASVCVDIMLLTQVRAKSVLSPQKRFAPLLCASRSPRAGKFVANACHTLASRISVPCAARALPLSSRPPSSLLA